MAQYENVEQYSQIFMSMLGTLVAEVLDFGAPQIGYLHAVRLFGEKSIAAANSAGFIMKNRVPPEFAVSCLITSKAIEFHRGTSTFGKLFSSATRKKDHDLTLLANRVLGTIREFDQLDTTGLKDFAQTMRKFL